MIPRIRDIARSAGEGQTVLIGGVTAENHDNLQALRRDAKLIVPLVLVLILLVLIALLRCVVAPLYLIGTVILSFAFALGLSSLIFAARVRAVRLGPEPRDLLLHLPGRARRRRQHLPDDGSARSTRRGMSTREAVIAGLERTGGVITSAGLILAGTFAALMALDLEALFQVGFTVALGCSSTHFWCVSFFVLSVALLLGDRNWWPWRFV